MVRFPQAWRWVFWACVVAAFVVALAPGQAGQDWFEQADKLRHGVAFACLWVLGRQARVGPGWALALGLLVLGALIEVAQGMTGYRQMSFWDWVADAAGVALGSLLLPLRPPTAAPAA